MDDQPDNNHLFDVRKERAGLFSIERATTALQHVYIRSIAHLPQHQQRLVCLSGLINLSHAAQVCAAGALLVIVQRAGLLPRGRVSRGLHLGGDDGQGCAVGMLESLTEAQLQGQLLVDTATLHALQVDDGEYVVTDQLCSTASTMCTSLGGYVEVTSNACHIQTQPHRYSPQNIIQVPWALGLPRRG